MEHKNKFTVICKKGNYALIDRNEQLKEIAVVTGLNEETGEWDGTLKCWEYSYNGVEYSNCTKSQALFKALNYFRVRTESDFISYDRMAEIATKMKDGLIEYDEDSAREFISEEIQPEEHEIEFLGLNELLETENKDDDYYCSSATAGDYSPSNPWDAPGMSMSDFI